MSVQQVHPLAPQELGQPPRTLQVDTRLASQQPDGKTFGLQLLTKQAQFIKANEEEAKDFMKPASHPRG
jgi:hypothetical protein